MRYFIIPFFLFIVTIGYYVYSFIKVFLICPILFIIFNIFVFIWTFKLTKENHFKWWYLHNPQPFYLRKFADEKTERDIIDPPIRELVENTDMSGRYLKNNGYKFFYYKTPIHEILDKRTDCDYWR